MLPLRNLLTFLLLSVSICQARVGGLRTGTQEKVTVQPWLVGLAAVVGFLFIVFFLLIVKRIFFKRETRDEKNMEFDGFENKALELETDVDSKVTNL